MELSLVYVMKIEQFLEVDISVLDKCWTPTLHGHFKICIAYLFLDIL